MKNSEKIIEEDKKAKERDMIAKCVGGLMLIGMGIAALGGYNMGYHDGRAIGHVEGSVQTANEFFRQFPELKGKEIYPTEF